MTRRPTLRCLLLSCFLLAAPAAAQTLPCKPCAGLRVTDPAAVAGLLAGAGLETESPLFIAWEAPLDGSGDATAAAAVTTAGATPWVSLPFRTAAPLLDHQAEFGRELEEAARLARQAPAGTVFQILWRPAPAATTDTATGSGADGADAAAEYAYLIKRAGVAVSGASAGARVASRPLPADETYLTALYGEEIAAYLDVVALAPAADAQLRAAIDLLAQLDPGRPVVIDAPPLAAEPSLALAEAARLAALGAGATLFAAGPAPVGAAEIAPFVLLAREFAGDLAYDPYSSPTVAGGGAGGGGEAGADAAWAFVRGSDLGLRVIARTPRAAGGGPADELALVFSDRQLRRPERVDPGGGEAIPLAGLRRTDAGLELRVADPGPVAVVRLERPTAAELEAATGVSGLEEKVTVSSEREMPVEEILRRLQAVEDAQERRIDHYSATNTTHLRFGAGTAGQSFEASIEGAFFFRRGADGTDWAWQTFFVNGVRWRGKSIPEFPLIQPEKAAALPLAITFDKTYRYRLRGTGDVDGRDCWVVDFAPAGETAAGGKLYRGTVWVDREIYVRVRTKAVQLGLEGEVISNEETLSYSPIDAKGAPAAWQAESFVLPLRVVSQQLLSIVNATTLVERETVLSRVVINGEDFELRRQEVLASDATMVRDTDRGLRYLVMDEELGERVVKEGFDTTKLFLLGGVFYDDSLDYPLPLAGINYFSFDFKGTGNQLNVFFAGALLTVNAAQPRLFGSRFDFGGDAFAIAVAFNDSQFRDNVEQKGEEVKSRPASASLKIGRPLGQFVKLGLEYRVGRFDYQTTKNTAPDFILPSDTFTQFVGLNARFARSGYSLTGSATYARRSTWNFWGLPGNGEFDPGQQDYLKWDAAVAKSWYLPRFQRIGLELDYLAGSDLDRFSKYEFGFFGGTRVHGYQSNRVRAERAWAAHASYGFELGELLRLDLVGDAALATDQLSGLKDELLAGAGIAGTFIGPWQTVINVDVGVPVAGPDDGFVAYLVFLKLFR